jgi:predicted  nucleic acid-binding Zn-ribbon protein
MADKVKKTDFLVDVDDPRARVSGEKGSEQNALRGELYTEALSRVKDAVSRDCYFEAVSLCDTMITDRFEALSQTLLHAQPKQFPSTSIVEATQFADSSYKQSGRKRSDEYSQLRDEVRSWARRRNEVIHNYVVVTNRSLKFDKAYRDEYAKKTATEGYKLVRKVLTFTRKEINAIKAE